MPEFTEDSALDVECPPSPSAVSVDGEVVVEARDTVDAEPLHDREGGPVDEREILIGEGLPHRPRGLEVGRPDALDRRDGDHTKPFELKASRQFRQRANGTLAVTPTLEPGDNVLFHDGTNTRLEYELTALAENGMAYEYATQMLKGRYDGLISAIRGTVG